MNPYERIDELETQMRQVLARLAKLEGKPAAALLSSDPALPALGTDARETFPAAALLSSDPALPALGTDARETLHLPRKDKH